MRLRSRARGRLAAAAVGLTAACATPAPVSDRTYAPTDGALERVAVIPFYTHRTYANDRLRGGVAEEIAIERVTHALARALSERGVYVIAPDAVSAAVSGVPRVTLAVDARVLADVAGRELGATGILLGEILRYRDALGVSPLARRPSSVAFHVALYATPTGSKVWAARFDETQTIEEPDLIDDPDAVAPVEPWKSADEIARSGAAAAADALLATR